MDMNVDVPDLSAPLCSTAVSVAVGKPVDYSLAAPRLVGRLKSMTAPLSVCELAKRQCPELLS